MNQRQSNEKLTPKNRAVHKYQGIKKVVLGRETILSLSLTYGGNFAIMWDENRDGNVEAQKLPTPQVVQIRPAPESQHTR